ncbi:uncharacterized protein LOC110237050 [Exaiptasia diaphana]|uniref:Uncharacterized protein n=1 Tax=Exaiptasia diaphana TaxID=2652724 RepID=A0A913X3C0_EXADI|nr:uncharacterized protein LOC110237050 [Exaiptasia diaphana]
MNKNVKLSKEDISNLETYITVFMALYRSFFPEASITPKLHFLEDHVIKWVKTYNIGFGLLGEQGIEGIHAEFNTLKKTYSCLRKPTSQLQCVMDEHHRRCHPENIMLTPMVKRRKKKLQEE